MSIIRAVSVVSLVSEATLVRVDIVSWSRRCGSVSSPTPHPPPPPGNNLGEAAGAALGKALETNSTLTRLDVGSALARPCPRMLPAGRGEVGTCGACV